MPHHGPLCPAFAQSQSLTLSPIQESAYSPLRSPEIAVFTDFSWTGVFSPIPPPSCGDSPVVGSDSSGVMSPGSPAGLLQRLDKLALEGIATDKPACDQTGVGLGFDLHIKLSSTGADRPSGKERRHSSVTTCALYTPANTPDCSRNRRRYSSFLAREAVYNYEEDAVEMVDLHRESSESDEADLLPMMGWLQNRLEEAAQREQYEEELDEQDLDMPESATLADIKTAVLVQKKVVKIEMNRAIANLRRIESVLQTPTRSKEGSDAMLPEDREVRRANLISRRQA